MVRGVVVVVVVVGKNKDFFWQKVLTFFLEAASMYFFAVNYSSFASKSNSCRCCCRSWEMKMGAKGGFRKLAKTEMLVANKKSRKSIKVAKAGLAHIFMAQRQVLQVPTKRQSVDF